MSPKDLKEVVQYWLTTSQHDYKTMLGLFRIKRYSDCLFYGHIVLEKILKALVVQKTKKQAPYTHNLNLLAKLTKIRFTKTDLELIKTVNRFNIRARYPDAKFEFYKVCTKAYTEKYLREIKHLYKILCQKVRP
ncbi:HEPN domain-containing protein [Patescibacteria group bacterium AH-259-L05]|nr:HEPN domain-containing protein [Patescibacteria group bacterium AH-259-L05]